MLRSPPPLLQTLDPYPLTRANAICCLASADPIMGAHAQDVVRDDQACLVMVASLLASAADANGSPEPLAPDRFRGEILLAEISAKR